MRKYLAVSVPLRGNVNNDFKVNADRVGKATYKFPSPYGEM